MQMFCEIQVIQFSKIISRTMIHYYYVRQDIVDKCLTYIRKMNSDILAEHATPNQTNIR